MLTIIFATGNPHKVEEVNSIMNMDDVLLKNLNDIHWTTEIIEDGVTFKENAFIKANTLFKEGHPCVLAEDSGLVVEALNGAPGIFSARYAGSQKSHADNNIKLLQELSTHQNRKAKFTATICYIEHGKIHYFIGECQGEILSELDGDKGFGYDPLFKPNGYDRSFAILGDRIKSNISHRAKAFIAFTEFLKQKNLK